MMKYRNHKIEKGVYNWYEATDLTDCDAYMLHAKTIDQLKEEIDEKLDQ